MCGLSLCFRSRLVVVTVGGDVLGFIDCLSLLGFSCGVLIALETLVGCLWILGGSFNLV